MPSYDQKMWSEFSATDRAEFRADWIRDWIRETRDSEECASLMYERYLDQEGYTSRDERIAIERSRSANG